MATRVGGIRLLVLFCVLFESVTFGVAYGQVTPMALKKAMSATELPVGAWGPYSQAHLGPCYMESRKNGQMFTFPIVVGQQRDEVLPFGGGVRLKPERVALIRRVMGLSPTGADGDAGGSPPIATVTEADASGLLWSFHASIPAAAVKQEISRRKDDKGLPIPPADWGKGAFEVSYFPAFGEQDVEGLVIRVAITNPSETDQNYFIDLCSGIENPDDAFSQQDLVWTIDPDGRGIAMQHSKAESAFAMEAQTGDHSIRSYAATSSLFAPDADICQRETTGALLPFGQKSGGANSAVKDLAAKPWGLLRLSGIAVPRGATRTLYLTVGIGKDIDTAHASASTLLSQADDFKSRSGAVREGLYSQAQKAHARVRYDGGEPALNHLMAQSLTNTPFHDFRCVGVPSRENGGVYRAGVGGWMALGWSIYRSDWSAAQLNAWFLSNNPIPSEIKLTRAVPPIDLFALWELVQSTHDRDLMERFYPYAVWRYQQFVEAGRQKEGEWLFAWPMMKENREALAAKPAVENRAEPAPFYSPDYSAYVIRAARILLACAKILEKSAVETDRFRRDADRATAAMNSELWDARRGVFLSKPVSRGDPVIVLDAESAARENGLDGLLPLIAGPEKLTELQRNSLLKTLLDENTFWSLTGLRGMSKESAAYLPDDGVRGGIRFDAQWLFWKALLDLGEEKRAAQLADRVLNAYHAAWERSGGCPEWLNAETGAPGGSRDYTGESCTLLALYESYHRPGTVSCGWDTYVVYHLYDKTADSLRVVFRALESTPKGVLLCAMGKPNGKYKVTGGISGTFAADASGVLALRQPDDTTNQQVEIAPEGNAK